MRLSDLQSKNVITTDGKLIGNIIDVVIEKGTIKYLIVEKSKFLMITVLVGDIDNFIVEVTIWPRQQHLLFRKNNIKQNLRIEGSLKHHFLFTETPILCLINQSKGSFT